MLKSPAALHGFLNTLYTRVDNPDTRQKAVETTDTFLFDYRNTTRSFLFDETEVPGLQSFVMAWQPTGLPGPAPRDDINHHITHSVNIKVMGLHHNGLYQGGKLNIATRLPTGSLGESWTQGIDDEDPHRAIALPMARFMRDIMLGQSTSQEDFDTIKALKGWDNIRNFESDLPLAISPHGGKAYAHCRENQRLAEWALKERLRNSGVISYEEEDTERDSQQIYAGIHKFSAAVMQQERKSVAMMAKSLIRHADPDALKVARSLNEVTPKAINYLQGQAATGEQADTMFALGWDEEETTDNTPTLDAYDDIPVDYKVAGMPEADPEIATYRRQAIGAYPALAGHFMRSPGFTKAIDEREPLAPVITRHFNLTPAHVKRLQGQTWQRTGRDIYRNPKDYSRSLFNTPVDSVPTDKNGWANFRTAHTLAKEFGENASLFSHNIMKSLNGRFGPVSKMAENHVKGGINDASRHINAHLTLPAVAQYLHSQGVDEETITTWIGSPSQYNKTGPLGQSTTLKGALETADKWHRVQARFDAAMLPPNSDAQPWPTLPTPQSAEGLDIVTLDSSEKLRQEGLKQGHCVGGYTSHCLSGNCVIFSLREKNKIVSTVEISINPDPKSKNKHKFSIGQNMGKNNSGAPHKGSKAGKAVLSALASLDTQTIETWKHNLQQEQEKRNKDKKTLKDKIGYNPLEKGKVEEAYTLMRPALPKAWAQKSFDAWMANTIAPIAHNQLGDLIEKHGHKKKTAEVAR